MADVLTRFWRWLKSLFVKPAPVVEPVVVDVLPPPCETRALQDLTPRAVRSGIPRR